MRSCGILSRGRFTVLALLGIAVRLALIATTAGTDDAVLKTMWADLVTRFGVTVSYAHSPLLNHPPLSLCLFGIENRVAMATGIAFPDVFRFVQVLGDGLAAFALYRIGLRESAERARWLALFVLLSPAAAFISGFHCNTDPLLAAFIAAAVMFGSEDRPVAAGTMLALATGIKIVPLLLLPLFLIVFRGRRFVTFAAAFAVMATMAFLPALLGGPPVLHQIFGYGGMDFEWGIPAIVLLLEGRRVVAPNLTGSGIALYGKLAQAAIVGLVGLLVLFGLRVRNRESFLAAVPAALLGILFLAPGFGVQYLAWPIALMPFALGRRAAVGLNAAISLMLFITYTVWNGGWPWWFASIEAPRPYRFAATAAALALWPLIGLAAAAATKRVIDGSRTPVRTGGPSPTAARRPSPGSD